jgi:hypothetical protein
VAITASDIAFHLSVSAAAGDTTAQGNVNASLGDQISTTTITDATLNNLFDDVSGDDNAASDVEYRCFFVRNNHATLTWQDVVVWLSAEVGGGASVAIAVDDAGPSDADQASAQAATSADEDTAPSPAQTFSSPTSKGTGLSIGDLAPDEVQAIWVRRTAANTSAVDNDGVTIRCEGDTAA